MMDKTEAERILAALKSGTPLVSRYKAAEALEWAMGPRWISVKDRLPEIGTDVLVCGYTGPAAVGYRLSGVWRVMGTAVPADEVTHWQPLPAGPGESDE